MSSINFSIADDLELYLGGANKDAFGRTRTSSPDNLFASTHLYTKASDTEQEIINGSATSTLSINDASVIMSVTANAADRVVRQSKRYIPYQAGRSFLAEFTGVLHTAVNPSLTCRIGLFDNHADKTIDDGGDGVFWEYSGGNYYFVTRSYTSGSQVDTKVIKSQWNVDKLDGSGPSGKTITEFTKSMIFFIDFQWLGVGRVRCGFVMDGVPYVCHQFLNDNVRQTVYMRRATLPIRYEISNTGGTGTGTMLHTCTSVFSEGGFDATGKPFAWDNFVNTLNVTNTNYTHIVTFRLKNAFNRSIWLPQYYEVLSDASNVDFGVFMLLNDTSPTHTVWTSIDDESNCEYATTAYQGTINGLKIAQSISSRQTRGDYKSSDSLKLGLAASIAGVSDTISFFARTKTSSSNINLAVGWKEIW